MGDGSIGGQGCGWGQGLVESRRWWGLGVEGVYG